MNEVVILKMITGDEIIAEAIGGAWTSDMKNKKFKSPRQFITQSDGRGGQSTGLTAYVQLAPDAEIEINMSLVVVEISAPAEVEKAYRSATSKIALI